MLAKIWANGLVILVAAILSMKLVVHLWLQVQIAGSLLLFLAGAFRLRVFCDVDGHSARHLYDLDGPVRPPGDPGPRHPANALSGSATPMESIPVWLQDAMQLFPTPHFVNFAQAVLYRAAGFD